MTKTLISSIAAATLVGSIGLVYAQSQGTDTYSQPAQTQTETTTSSATSSATNMDSNASTTSGSYDSSNNAANSMDESSSLDAQADRN